MPLLPADVQKVDHLLLTHEHYDHFDPVGLKNLAAQPQTTIAPKACHEELIEVAGIPPESITEASYGLTLDYEAFSLQVIPATHKNTPGACGYLIETRHGNIYHPGDGQFDQDDKELVTSLDVQVLLLPINDTNLGVGFAALLTQLLQPTVRSPVSLRLRLPAGQIVRRQSGRVRHGPPRPATTRFPTRTSWSSTRAGSTSLV